MTDYNNEQNNVFGEVQPMEAPSVEAEPVAVAEPQPVAPVVDTPAEIPPVVEPVVAVEAPAFVAEAVAQPQVAEPVAPTYQEPVQPQVAEPVVPVYQAPVYQETVPPAQIPVAPTYQAPAEPQPPKKSSAPIVVGILAVLLVIALAVILVFALGDKDDSDDKNGKGNKKETEQVDDTDSSEDDDADEDDKTDKDDTNKDDTNKDDKDNNKDDKNDKNDKNENTDDDDTSVIAPAAKGYTEYLDAFCGFCCGDVYQFESLLPEALWDIMRVACAEELGYLPTKEEVIELMLSETEDLEFLDETTYDILSESVADDRDVRMMQNALMEVLVLDEIEEAYELHIKWTMKADGKTLEYEERVYAIYFDGEWTLMSENYIPYCTDMEEFGQEMENTFGANYI